MQKKQLQLDSTSGEINTSPGPGSSDQYIFDDCGHLSHEECADELVNVLAHFLSSSP
jgi:pimeloyl-ACP methyl ester carboxylesterase